MSAALAATCAAAAAMLWCSGPVGSAATKTTEPTGIEAPRTEGWLHRLRPLWAVLAGAVAGMLFDPPLAIPTAGVAAVVTWVLVGRAESPADRRARVRARRDLPHVVGLLADALGAGQSSTAAIQVVTTALPGPASDLLAVAGSRLALGVEPGTVWSALAEDPAMAPLGRTFARAHATGASVVGAVERLAQSLAETGRAEVEDRARAVGVKAA
uniref:type II secretion system F family protein n=1 Tax=Nocardioides sp. TaxID=35761 RepID=UPI003565E514